MDRITFLGNRATGILLANKRHILTTHEVILSAGAILSPAILQRSGIGPSQLLHRHGILSLVDLPVGLSAYGHPCIPIVARPRPGSYDKVDYSLQCQARWSSSLRPGTVDHQLVCFSYLFAEAPDPQVQQRSLAGVSSGHVAGIGCNLNKPTWHHNHNFLQPQRSPRCCTQLPPPPLTGNQLVNLSVPAIVSSVHLQCNLCWNHPLTSLTPLSIPTPSSTNTFTRTLHPPTISVPPVA